MFNPLGNINEMIRNLQVLMQKFYANPMMFMATKGLNIPKEYENNPDGAIQYLLNNGKMTQQQYNYLRNLSDQIQMNVGNNNNR